MKILFLDIDGVFPQQRLEGRIFLESAGVQRLERIMTVSGCAVVVSSVWRKRRPLPEIQFIFERSGLPQELALKFIGTTGDLAKSMCRGQEVDTWLRALGGHLSLAILDDDSDLEPYLDRLVHVDSSVGLTDQNVEDVLRLFA